LEQRAGFQDEAAAIYGGVNYWKFSPIGSITRIPLPEERVKYLENKLVLVYTGENHLSPNIHDNVFGEENYSRNIPKLHRMKEIAHQMFQEIDDPNTIPQLIRETWELQRSLDSSIETDTMRILQNELAGEYLACRATGAGGGGCMIFYTETPEKLSQNVAGISKKRSLLNLKVIPFKFDYKGILIE
jgi:galactokinase/mevalonate kinase-like predicted kinase